MAINKDITCADSCCITAIKTLKDTGSHTEAVTLEVSYCVCDADDDAYRVNRNLRHTIADPTAVTLAQAIDAIRNAIKTAEDMS